MTVQELIDELKKRDPNNSVVIFDNILGEFQHITGLHQDENATVLEVDQND